MIKCKGRETCVCKYCVMEELFKLLCDVIPLAMFVEDLDGNIHCANKAAIEMFGYPLEDFKNMKVSKLLPDKNINVLLAFTGTLMRENTSTVETENVRANGEIFPVRVTAARMSENICPSCYFVLVEDLTSTTGLYRKYTHALRESQDKAENLSKLTELFDMASNKSNKPQIITDEEFDILFINGSAAKILNISTKVVGENIVRLLGLGSELTSIKEILESTHYYEKVVSISNKAIYFRVRALYNSIVKGYAFYLSPYDLMQDIKKLEEMGYINNGTR